MSAGMSAGAQRPDVPPAASPVGQASTSPTPDPTPLPIELVELVELDGPGTSCRLDGTCD